MYRKNFFDIRYFRFCRLRKQGTYECIQAAVVWKSNFSMKLPHTWQLCTCVIYMILHMYHTFKKTKSKSSSNVKSTCSMSHLRLEDSFLLIREISVFLTELDLGFANFSYFEGGERTYLKIAFLMPKNNWPCDCLLWFDEYADLHCTKKINVS